MLAGPSQSSCIKKTERYTRYDHLYVVVFHLCITAVCQQSFVLSLLSWVILSCDVNRGGKAFCFRVRLDLSQHSAFQISPVNEPKLQLLVKTKTTMALFVEQT